MRRLGLIAAALFAVWAAALPATAADAPVSLRQYASHTILDRDGSSVSSIHVEIAVDNDAAAQREAQQLAGFTDGMDTMELVEGYTQKPDGTRLPIPPGAVRTQLAPGVPNAPEYTDRKQVVAVFPGVAGGDVLVLTWRHTVTRTPIPGFAAFTNLFAASLPWDDASIEIDAPADLALRTETHGPTSTETELDGGRRLYRWHWQAPAKLQDSAALLGLDRAPRMFASMFPDWTAFGRAYAAMVGPRSAVTPAIQALADEIAAPARDRRDEARLLYEWVGAHIRWVAIYVANGGYDPHAAEQTLANRFGDCKDQAVLLTALLQARGIPANPVLIHVGASYTLSGPPTYTAFNHAITYVPEWDLYADTTADAPFGTLPLSEYGKPVVHATATGAVLQTTPVLPPGVATERLDTAMQLDSTGRITGTTTTTATGPFATELRAARRRAQASGSERAVVAQLRSWGQQGSGAFDLAAAQGSDGDASLSGRFELAPQSDWLDGDSFVLPTGLRVGTRPGDGLLGPLYVRDLPASEPTPCYAGTQEEHLSLGLPPGWRPLALPRPRAIETAAFSYRSTWTLEDGTLHVRRRFSSAIDAPLCTGVLRESAASALALIRRDLDARVTLEAVE